LISSQDWGGLDYIEQQFDKKRAELLAEHASDGHRRRSIVAGLLPLLQDQRAGMLILSADGRILHVGSTMLAWLGMAADDLVGRTLFDIFPRAEAVQRFRLCREALACRETRTIQERASIGLVDTVIAPIVPPDGQGGCVVVMVRPLHHPDRVFELAFQPQETRLID